MFILNIFLATIVVLVVGFLTQSTIIPLFGWVPNYGVAVGVASGFLGGAIWMKFLDES